MGLGRGKSVVGARKPKILSTFAHGDETLIVKFRVEVVDSQVFESSDKNHVRLDIFHGVVGRVFPEKLSFLFGSLKSAE